MRSNKRAQEKLDLSKLSRLQNEQVSEDYRPRERRRAAKSTRAPGTLTVNDAERRACEGGAGATISAVCERQPELSEGSNAATVQDVDASKVYLNPVIPRANASRQDSLADKRRLDPRRKRIVAAAAASNQQKHVSGDFNFRAQGMQAQRPRIGNPWGVAP